MMSLPHPTNAKLISVRTFVLWPALPPRPNWADDVTVSKKSSLTFSLFIFLSSLSFASTHHWIESLQGVVVMLMWTWEIGAKDAATWFYFVQSLLKSSFGATFSSLTNIRKRPSERERERERKTDRERERERKTEDTNEIWTCKNRTDNDHKVALKPTWCHASH